MGPRNGSRSATICNAARDASRSAIEQRGRLLADASPFRPHSDAGHGARARNTARNIAINTVRSAIRNTIRSVAGCGAHANGAGGATAPGAGHRAPFT